MAHHLSAISHIQSDEKNIFHQKSYVLGAASIQLKTGLPLAPCVPLPFNIFSAITFSL